MRYVDPDGMDVENNTSYTLIIKPEHDEAPYVILEPGQKYKGEQDGVLCPDGTTLKCYDKAMIKVMTKDEDGKFYFKGGTISKVLGNILKFLKNKSPSRERRRLLRR